MGNSLLEKQIQTSEEQNENNFGRPGPGQMGGNVEKSNQTSNYETIDDIDVSVKVNDYLILFAIGYLVSIVAMVIPSINVAKYEPKTILTGRQ